ncbi:hypothetical protein [Geobacter sp. SVR]|uniref:hypothetical protein n=1 Tax=Geobacter sp. SVR TaxID=2495594 RepID=UPI0015638FC1|nr:hypothetical protein [Geobacter sp. SVR]
MTLGEMPGLGDGKAKVIPNKLQMENDSLAVRRGGDARRYGQLAGFLSWAVCFSVKVLAGFFPIIVPMNKESQIEGVQTAKKKLEMFSRWVLRMVCHRWRHAERGLRHPAREALN